ncbi:GDSL esterase/lipase 5 [Quercus suber]|uniref:GDSL esterase/lipase 5 n=1 Tax=Quercus suber TaxID=58331 RepID=UPI0032DE8BF4
MSLRFHFYFLVLYACIFIPTQCLGKICLQKEHAALFVFGDSLVDVGTNNYINTLTDYQANFPPYGETFFKYPTGRASNGRLIPDFLAEYANLELIPPYQHPGYHRYVDGANFASGAAGTLDETRPGLGEAFNAARVDADAELRRTNKVYYPPALRIAPSSAPPPPDPSSASSTPKSTTILTPTSSAGKEKEQPSTPIVELEPETL